MKLDTLPIRILSYNANLKKIKIDSMKCSEAIYKGIRDANISFITSVPCANLKNILSLVENNSKEGDFIYIPATREEEAIGLCTGAHLAGKKTAILMQNSGLGNSINGIGSLCKVYQIPILMIISHRGDLKEKIPAQIPMGRWTKKLLNTIEVPYYCPKTPDEAYDVIKYSSEYSETMGYPVAVLLDALYWEYDK